MTAADPALKRMMLEYWSRFAASGNLNGDGLVQWPQYHARTDDYLDINASAFSGTDLRREKYDFWDHVQESATAVKRSPQKSVDTFTLLRNYPNPFNPGTTIRFTLANPGHVRLEFFNAKGEKVAILIDRMINVGGHKVIFESNGLSSGLYFYQLKVGYQLLTRKCL